MEEEEGKMGLQAKNTEPGCQPPETKGGTRWFLPQRSQKEPTVEALCFGAPWFLKLWVNTFLLFQTYPACGIGYVILRKLIQLGTLFFMVSLHSRTIIMMIIVVICAFKRTLTMCQGLWLISKNPRKDIILLAPILQIMKVRHTELRNLPKDTWGRSRI